MKNLNFKFYTGISRQKSGFIVISPFLSLAYTNDAGAFLKVEQFKSIKCIIYL